MRVHCIGPFSIVTGGNSDVQNCTAVLYNAWACPPATCPVQAHYGHTLQNSTVPCPCLQVYYDYMRSFRQEFDDFFQDGTIVEVEVGLGPCGSCAIPRTPRATAGSTRA